MLSRTQYHNHFEEFINTYDPISTSSEDLLDWMSKVYPYASYQDYLRLRKQTAEQGYKTAFDLPLTEDEFKYRNVLKQFLQWNADNQLTSVDAYSLLNWLFMHQSDIALNHHEFIALTHVGANQGWVTAIDVPITDAEYNKKYIQSELFKYHNEKKQAIHEFQLTAYEIERKYFDSVSNLNERCAELIQLIKRVANSESLQYLSAMKINDVAKGVRVFCQRIIENEYQGSGFLFNKGSLLYSLIKSELGINHNEEHESQYLAAFRNYIKDAPNHIAEGSMWRSKDVLLSEIYSTMREIHLTTRYLISLNISTPLANLFSGHGFFSKKNHLDSTVNKLDEKKDEDNSCSLSL